MPPKRKNKAATKASASTALFKATQAGTIRTSSTKRKSSVPGGVKTSRLQPTEPLHMTTRKAAKAASNHTSPAAPSVAGGSSRRSSLNDVAQFEDRSDLEDARPPKRSRVSTGSGSPPNSMGSQVSQIPVLDTHTPDMLDAHVHLASRAESDSSKSTGKKRRASGDSSESSKTVSVRPNGHVTRSESDVSEKQPRRKKRKTAETPADPAEPPPELTDGSTPPQSPEPVPEVDGSQALRNVLPNANGELPAKAARRLPGRRRQPHSDINVETDLRRQLNIKMGYRTVAKIQKSILEELSKRSLDNLETDPDFHRQCPEYDHLMAQLGQRRQGRLDQVGAERRLRLDELARVQAAEEYIEQEQYINRFKELQEDLLLQCFYRCKQLEREMKAQSGDATDDEDHIIEPTRMDFPAHKIDDRLGSLYASRSRAYVETERLLERESLRDLFNQQRKTFLAENEDYDDSVDNVPGGFATFIGPDRADAEAHWNISSLADAATLVETAPPEPEPPKVILNEDADALFMLASISAERPPAVKGHNVVVKLEQLQQAMPPAQVFTPAQQTGLPLPVSPSAPMSTTSTAMSMETAETSPAMPLAVQHMRTPQTISGQVPVPRAEAPKNETPVRLSTHRIMDILNNDEDVRVPTSRESQASIHEHNSATSPSRNDKTFLNQPRPQTDQLRMDAILHPQPDSADRRPPSFEAPGHAAGNPPPASNQFWFSSMTSGSPELTPSDPRNPLKRIRQMLEVKKEQQRQKQSGDNMDRREGSQSRQESVEPTQMAPPLPRPFSPPDTTIASRDTNRSSVGTYNASPSTVPMHYDRSPRDRPTSFPPPPRQVPYDQGLGSQWGDGGRRMSGSQGPPPPPPQYAGSPPQSYRPVDHHNTGPTPTTHHSPRLPGTNQLPPMTQPQTHSLPPKPPVAPMNYRFAYHDPAPARPPYQPHGQYAVTTLPPPQPGPPHPPSYPRPYSTSSPYSGYVPPPGSFQAPPPPSAPAPQPPQQGPPPPQPYPPLKIHQYGGQPILPASMAPPQQPSQPPSLYGSHVLPAPPQAYAPQGPHPGPQGPPRSPYEQSPGQGPSSDRLDTQPRPRRQYRAYHAPGTEFRTYQPNQRRRGG